MARFKHNIQCTCGNDLRPGGRMEIDGTIILPPCTKCLTENYNRGYRRGQEENTRPNPVSST
jgi:hypothetical protein